MKLLNLILATGLISIFFACNSTTKEQNQEIEKENIIVTTTPIETPTQGKEQPIIKNTIDSIPTTEKMENKNQNLLFLSQDSIDFAIQQHNQMEDMEMILFSKKDHFICYTSDEKKNLNLQIMFDEKDIGLIAKYKVGTYGLELVYLGEEFIKGGAHPTIHNYYAELVKGEFNGTYKLTHSGIYEYAQYTGKNGNVFNFTVNLDLGRTEETCL